MTYRVAVAGLVHETNTYATNMTGFTDVERFELTREGEIIARNAHARTYVGGMIAAANEHDIELLPTLHAYAWPSGTIGRATYEALRDEIVERLAELPNLDGICLDLHGAGVAEGIDDVEVDLLAAIRERLGSDVVITASLDLHGNLSETMAAHLDGMFGTELYPHTDMWERGYEAMAIIPRLVDGSLRTSLHIERLPLIIPNSTTDPGHPAAEMNELCRAAELDPRVIDCTVFHGFSFTDTPLVGVSVAVTTDGDPDLASATAKHIGRWVWENRDRFRPETYPPEQAVRIADSASDFPVVINDTSDNPGGGTPGDGTHLLRALIEARIDEAAFGFIADPGVVEQAIRAGVGRRIQVALGGKHGDLHGTPIEASAYVKSITDGTFLLQAMGAGRSVSIGTSVLLLLEGVEVIVSTLANQVFDPEVFLLHGIDVRRKRIVAVKSSHHFRAGFRDIAARIITADSPGLTSQMVERFEHTRLAKPTWPFSTEAAY